MRIAGIALCGLLLTGSLSAGPGRRDSLRHYLTALGEARDCYFTVELVSSSRQLIDTTGANDTDNQSASVEEIISKVLQEFKVSRYKDSNVYALIDKKLLEIQEYSLNAVELPGSYHGSPVGLIRDLRQRHPNLTLQTLFNLNDIRLDGSTELNFSFDKRSVRDVLTIGVPFKGYSRVIWISETTLNAPPQTAITFQGRARK